jgi:hypothetical protein
VEIRKVHLPFETQAFHTEIDFSPCIQTISRASKALKPTRKPDLIPQQVARDEHVGVVDERPDRQHAAWRLD